MGRCFALLLVRHRVLGLPISMLLIVTLFVPIIETGRLNTRSTSWNFEVNSVVDIETREGQLDTTSWTLASWTASLLYLKSSSKYLRRELEEQECISGEFSLNDVETFVRGVLDDRLVQQLVNARTGHDIFHIFKRQ